MTGFVLDYRAREPGVKVRIQVSAPPESDLELVRAVITEAAAVARAMSRDHWTEEEGR